MEVYILDALFRRIEVVDKFESLIWTERWDDIGDFELHLPSNNASRSLFKPDINVAVNDSHRVMTIETVEDNTDTENRRMLKVKGRSIERITQDRLLLSTFGGYSLLEYYFVNNQTAADAMRQMFSATFNIRGGVVNPNDSLPLYVEDATLFPPDTIPEPTDLIVQNLEPGMVYDGLRSYSQIYDLGWRLYRNYDTVQLFFNVYAGSNRTVRQTALDAVVFSPELENLQNTTEFETTEGAKNVAYVFATVTNSGAPETDGFQHVNVYAPGTDIDVAGFDRRAMLVKLGTIDASQVTDVQAEMTRAGVDALAKTRGFKAFDGEIPQYTNYKYDVDYYLGDLVTMQNIDGYMNDMRVTEQIMVSDKEGDRSYPTLSLRQFYTPGTWQQTGFSGWADAGTTEYWSNQP